MPTIGRRHILGNAVHGVLASDMAADALSFNLAASPGASGWPTGGASGRFTVTVSPNQPNEERIDCQSRSSLNVAIAALSDRGVDGTAAVFHAAGDEVWITDSGFEADWANLHYSDTTHDHHTQYLNSARHAAIVHTSAMLGVDSVTASQIATNAVGTLELADNAVDTNSIINLAVTTGKLNDLAVTTPKLGDDSVTSAKIAPATIATSDIGLAQITNALLALNSVGTTNIVDAAITLAKFAGEAGTSFVPNFPTVNLGAVSGSQGTKFGRSYKFGRFVAGIAGFHLGVGGNVTGTINFTIPDAANIFNASGIASATGWITAARASDVSASAVFSGLGAITNAGVCTNWVTAGASANWDGNTPFTWTVNDVFHALFVYEATTP